MIRRCGLIPLLLAGAGWGGSPQTQPASGPAAGGVPRAIRCVVPTPGAWTGPGLTEAFATAASLAPVVCLPDPVDWFAAEGRPPEQSKPHRDAQWQRMLLARHKLGVFIQVDPYRDRRGPIRGLPAAAGPAHFGNPKLRHAFREDALSRVRLYQPAYVCLAMEINAYFEQHPEDFDNFVSLFHETRTEIRKVRPEALVFVSFQYEQLLGRFGGPAGLVPREPHWKLLSMFDQADAVGISSYPMASFSPPKFGSPADLPAEYYRRLAAHTNKPIVFAELGWPSDPRFGGSPESQAAFLRRLPDLLRGLDVRLINWNFLYDTKGYGEVFESMGLITSDGRRKPAFEVFRGL